jgi:hypothetical protein
MAGDWIKLEIATSDKPEVWQIGESLGIDPDAVVGKLIRVWAWFDQQTLDGNAKGNATSVTTGNAASVTKSATMALLDRKVGVTGFCAAMISVGWMLDDSGALTLPNFDRHNGKTAKTRALTAKRVLEHKKKGNAGANDLVTLPALPREEKRREEKIEDSKAVRPKFTPPTLEDVSQYITENQYPVDAERFIDYYQANGWVQGKGKPIKDWKATVRTWSKNQSTFTGHQQPAESRYNLLTRD